jgi:hypothetical protein
LSNPFQPELASGLHSAAEARKEAGPAAGEAAGPVLAPASLTATSDQLVKLRQQINRLHRTLRLTIEAELGSLVGRSFGNLAANQEVVLVIHEMLEAHGLRVRCPVCGHPAILRCSERPGVASGAFVLDHTIEGRRTFHGGFSVLPELHLVAKPARRSAKRAS